MYDVPPKTMILNVSGDVGRHLLAFCSFGALMREADGESLTEVSGSWAKGLERLAVSTRN